MSRFQTVENHKPVENSKEQQSVSKKQVRRKFTKEEDAKLLDLVKELGDYDWTTIASRLSGRSPRQCRERYRNYLAPRLVNGPWTASEDALLIEKFSQYGPRWASLVQFFQNRSDVNIKNRWASIAHRMAKRAAKMKAARIVVPMPKIYIQPQAVKEEEKDTFDFTLGDTDLHNVAISDLLYMDTIDPFEY